MQCSCLKTYTFSFNLSSKVDKFFMNFSNTQIHTKQKLPRVILNVLVWLERMLKPYLIQFLPIVVDTEQHDFEFISSQRYWIRSFILFISTKKDPFIHDIKKINLRKLWEINSTSNTEVTHHFYVFSLGESIEIKVQKQCGKTLFGNEEHSFLCRLCIFFLLDSHVLEVK